MNLKDEWLLSKWNPVAHYSHSPIRYFDIYVNEQSLDYSYHVDFFSTYKFPVPKALSCSLLNKDSQSSVWIYAGISVSAVALLSVYGIHREFLQYLSGFVVANPVVCHRFFPCFILVVSAKLKQLMWKLLKNIRMCILSFQGNFVLKYLWILFKAQNCHSHWFVSNLKHGCD